MSKACWECIKVVEEAVPTLSPRGAGQVATPLCESLISLGRYHDAISTVRELLERFYRDCDADELLKRVDTLRCKYFLAEAIAHTGNLEEARREFEQAAIQHPLR